jgi:hypothetical protein
LQRSSNPGYDEVQAVVAAEQQQSLAVALAEEEALQAEVPRVEAR